MTWRAPRHHTVALAENYDAGLAATAAARRPPAPWAGWRPGRLST